MEIFINGTGIISPQPTSGEIPFSLSSMKAAESNRLRCIEPDYKNFVPPTLLRRMSRIIKMGMAATKICLANADVEKPDAIIIGTGLGCIEDTEKFIHAIIENEEQFLPPTPFIQSTHNTVGGQIALHLNCHEYNYTYAHRGTSFESALLDGMLLIEEKSTESVLVGGIDELTDNSFKLMQQLGIYSTENKIERASGGEGAAFFLLSSKKTEKSLAKISLLKTLSGKFEAQVLSEKIKQWLVESSIKLEDIETVLLGKSGNGKSDYGYKELEKGIFKDAAIKTFKQYCGEYATASSFALWLATELINNKESSSTSNVLIYNNFEGVDHGLILIEKC